MKPCISRSRSREAFNSDKSFVIPAAEIVQVCLEGLSNSRRHAQMAACVKARLKVRTALSSEARNALSQRQALYKYISFHADACRTMPGEHT